MAGSRVAGSWTSPRTGVPVPRYPAGFLVMATTSWPARSRAAHNRWPTKPDAPATTTFTGPPRVSRAGPASAIRPDRAVTRTYPGYPAPPTRGPRSYTRMHGKLYPGEHRFERMRQPVQVHRPDQQARVPELAPGPPAQEPAQL